MANFPLFFLSLSLSPFFLPPPSLSVSLRRWKGTSGRARRTRTEFFEIWEKGEREGEGEGRRVYGVVRTFIGKGFRLLGYWYRLGGLSGGGHGWKWCITVFFFSLFLGRGVGSVDLEIFLLYDLSPRFVEHRWITARSLLSFIIVRDNSTELWKKFIITRQRLKFSFE